ncbi:BTB/POZ and MATH domain-containing protein 4-like [Belonocnema kinseyi]|uniref:BTB/POZ and MATH domain-containing protein 4-like n=1 Tax=Belonocnema kinseyi TaxID=2817044 RepID=UPI00143D2970|nr:BTB/POZ and MATH domain-containing protein 4-like [Belonocnema kinseyi]
MATVLNLLDLTNDISENAHRNAENKKKIKTSVNSLILINTNTLKSGADITFEIIVNMDPKIVCSFYVSVRQTCYVSITVTFKPNVPDTFKYELSLYHINSTMTLNFLEVLHLENITEKSTFNCMQPLQIFTSTWYGNSNRIDLFSENLINMHLCVYCRITRKDIIIPLEVEIPPSEMGQQFYSLYENKTLTDFKIISRDNQVFLAHKVVLAARSPVFNEFQESQKNEVEINDFRSDIVELMLRHIYTDSIENLNEENVEAVLAIADKYGLKNLKLLCMQQISKCVNNIAKALDSFSIAENYNVTEFKEMAVEFIKNNRLNL